jgi:hypothetical protein
MNWVLKIAPLLSIPSCIQEGVQEACQPMANSQLYQSNSRNLLPGDLRQDWAPISAMHWNGALYSQFEDFQDLNTSIWCIAHRPSPDAMAQFLLSRQ